MGNIHGPAPERFWKRVNKEGQEVVVGGTVSNCWEWLGRKWKNGYGAFDVDNRAITSHKWAWQEINGPVPEGLELDHICRNRGCVNPNHLEAVTHAENVRRGISIVAQHAKKTHCPEGHEYDDKIQIRKNGKKQRICSICRNSPKMKEYWRNYMKNRRHNDPEFAERQRAANRKSARRLHIMRDPN